jgi:membrane protease YdiL (CAAX protease family)
MLSLSRTRQDVWVFLALLAVFSSAFYALVLLRSDAGAQWSVYAAAFMWCPGLAAIVTCLARDRTLRGLGWGWGHTRFYPIAYGLALVVCLLPYVVVWIAFDAFDGRQLAATFAKAGLPPMLAGPAGVLAIGLVVLPLTSLVSAAGEEIGWRGFLVPRLHALLGFTGTSLLVGLIWAAWHYPINAAVFPLHRPNVPLWYANACFTLLVIGAAFMHTWLRLRSRSVWPSTLLHASGNAFQGMLQAATRETEVTSYLTTEYGAAFAVMGCFLVILFWSRRGEVEPAPGPSPATAG